MDNGNIKGGMAATMGCGGRTFLSARMRVLSIRADLEVQKNIEVTKRTQFSHLADAP